MGNKRKYSKKKSKLMRRKIAIKNLAEYRKRNRELRELSESPKEENDRANADIERQLLEEVLQIKVEEPEITGGVDEDCSTILIDHSYSAIAIKAEPDDCVQYVPRLWPLYEIDSYRLNTSETVASQIIDDQSPLKVNLIESVNKDVYVKYELPSDDDSEVERQTESDRIVNEIVADRNNEVNGKVHLDLVETYRYREGGDSDEENELVDVESVNSDDQIPESEYFLSGSETQTKLENGRTPSTDVSRRCSLRVKNHLELARSNVADSFGAQDEDRNDASFEDMWARCKIDFGNLEDFGNESETVSSIGVKVSKLMVKNQLRNETSINNIPILHNQHLNKLVELTNSIGESFFESKIENKDDTDTLLTSCSVPERNIAVTTPLNIIQEHSYVMNIGGNVLDSTSFAGNCSVRVKTQGAFNASTNLREDNASCISGGNSALKNKNTSSPVKRRNGNGRVRKRSRNKLHEAQYKFKIVRIMEKLSEDELEMIKNSTFLARKKRNRQSTVQTRNSEKSIPNRSTTTAVKRKSAALNFQSIENLSTIVRNDLSYTKNESRGEILNRTVKNQLAESDAIITGRRFLRTELPNTRNATRNSFPERSSAQNDEDASLELPGQFQSDMSLCVDKIIRGLFDENEDDAKDEHGLSSRFSREDHPQNLSDGVAGPVGNHARKTVKDTPVSETKDEIMETWSSGKQLCKFCGSDASELYVHLKHYHRDEKEVQNLLQYSMCSSIGKELFRAIVAGGYDMYDPIRRRSRHLRDEIQKESRKVTGQSRSKSFETSEVECGARNRSLMAQNQTQNELAQKQNEVERDASTRATEGASGSLAGDHAKGMEDDCDKSTFLQLSGGKTDTDNARGSCTPPSDNQFSKLAKEPADLTEEKVEESTEFSKPSPPTGQQQQQPSQKIKTRNVQKKKQIKCTTCSKTLKPRALYFHSLSCSAKNSNKCPKVTASEVEIEDLDRLISELQAEFSTRTWTELLKCSIRTMQDVNGMFAEILLISDYEKRTTFDKGSDEWTGCFTKEPLKVIVLSNCDDKWALLTAKQEEGIELILKYRKEVGVPDGSPYVFQYPLVQKETHVSSPEARNDCVLPVDFHVGEVSASPKVETVDTAAGDAHSKPATVSKSSKFRFVKKKFKKPLKTKKKGLYKCFRLKTNKTCVCKKQFQRINVKDVVLCKKCNKYFLKNYFHRHRLRCIRTPKANVEEIKTKKPEDLSHTFDSNCPVLQSPSGVKKYFCVFCKKTLTKLKRHMETVHGDEKEVQEMVKCPEKSAQRMDMLYKLRARGTFLFNKTSKYNRGQIIVSRRPNPTLKRTSEDFLPCPHCGNYLSKRTLHRHTKRCSENGGSQRNVRRMSLALVNYRHPKCNKFMATKIIPKLLDDAVSDLVKTDDLIILFGNHLAHKHAATNGSYVRQSLRRVGKLLYVLKRLDPRAKEFSSVFSPEHCELVIDAIKEVAEYDSETDRFKLFEAAKKLGTNVRMCGEIWSMECSKVKKIADRERAVEFLTKFSQMYKRDVYDKLPKQRPKTPAAMPKMLFKLSRVRMLELAKRLRSNFTKEAWSDLVDCLLIQLRLLNDNVLEDGETLRVSDYLQRHSVDSDEKFSFYHTLEELPADFPKNYVKVKLEGSATVSLLLSQEFCGAADVLLENREDAGVSGENVYLFGCPGEKDGHFKTNDAKNRFCSKSARRKANSENSDRTRAKPNEPSYYSDLTVAYAYHSNRMAALKETLNANFADRVWIELTKEVLACVQLMNDKTFAEVVQYTLLDDYEKRGAFDPQEQLGVYSTLCERREFPDDTGGFFKLNLRGTPVHLLLSAQICEAIDLLVRGRSSAKIDPKNPYVFACSGNKYNYYRTEGCIGNLPVTNDVDGIFSLRATIIGDLVEKESVGVELSKFLPESDADAVSNTVKLFHHVQFKMVELKYKLEEHFSSKIWWELTKCLLTYLHFLNTRVLDDPEKLLISDYNDRRPLDETDTENAYHSLDDVSDFPQNYVKVKMSESASYLLLSLDFNEAVDVLLKRRSEAGVRADNPYVFGCRGDKGNFIATRRAMCYMAARCGVKRLKYSKAKKVGDEIELQGQFVEVKEISKTVSHVDLKKSRYRRRSTPSDSVPSRRLWTREETDVATKHLISFLKKETVPRIALCDEIISGNPELQTRTPRQLQAWANNQIKRQKTLNCDNDERPPSKPVAKSRWSNTEQGVVKASFRDYLESGTLPSADECRRVISLHPELSGRTPEQTRSWISNQNKKKFGCRRKPPL